MPTQYPSIMSPPHPSGGDIPSANADLLFPEFSFDTIQSPVKPGKQVQLNHNPMTTQCQPLMEHTVTVGQQNRAFCASNTPATPMNAKTPTKGFRQLMSIGDVSPLNLGLLNLSSPTNKHSINLSDVAPQYIFSSPNARMKHRSFADMPQDGNHHGFMETFQQGLQHSLDTHQINCNFAISDGRSKDSLNVVECNQGNIQMMKSQTENIP